jgi:hypothetical protein
MRSANRSLIAKNSCFLHHRLSGYAHGVWEGGARSLGVRERPTRVSSALLIGCGSGTANSTRSYHQPNNRPKKEPRRRRRGYRLLFRTSQICTPPRRWRVWLIASPSPGCVSQAAARACAGLPCHEHRQRLNGTRRRGYICSERLKPTASLKEKP